MGAMPNMVENNRDFIVKPSQGLLELFGDGICIRCGGDDVECLEDCTIHKCIDCGHIEGYQDYSTLKDTVDSSGG